VVVAGISWNAMLHRDAADRFSAGLTPVRTDGYALVLPDLAAQAERYGPGGLLGGGPLRLSVGQSSVPVIIAIGPSTLVSQYLAGVAHTEITAVGQAEGPQPVTTVFLAGIGTPAPMLGERIWSATSASSLDWDGSGVPQSLVVMRADGTAGFEVALIAARDASGLTTVTWSALVAGVFGVLGGLALVFWPSTRRETVLVLESHRMVDFADRIAERMGGPKAAARRGRRPRPYADVATAVTTAGTEVAVRSPSHDLTGEFVSVPEDSIAPWRDRDRDTDRRDAGRHHQQPHHWGSHGVQPGVNQRRPQPFDRGGRRNSRFGPAASTEWAEDATTTETSSAARRDRGVDEPTGESPYVSTAT